MYSEKNLVYMGIWGESNCILFKQSKKIAREGFSQWGKRLFVIAFRTLMRHKTVLSTIYFSLSQLKPSLLPRVRCFTKVFKCLAFLQRVINEIIYTISMVQKILAYTFSIVDKMFDLSHPGQYISRNLRMYTIHAPL